MSQNEFHSGKLKKVDFAGSTLEEWCKAKCEEKEIYERGSYHDSWEETFRDEFYEKFLIVEGVVYELIEHYEADDDPYFVRLKPEPDGTISFVTQFYNGGTCLSECLEEGIADLKKNNEQA